MIRAENEIKVQELSDQELDCLIAETPIDVLLTPLKHNSKQYGKITRTARLDSQNHNLRKVLPKWVKDFIREGDLTFINILSKRATIVKDQFSKLVDDVCRTDNYFASISGMAYQNFKELIYMLIFSGDTNLDCELVLLQFKLLGFELSPDDITFIMNDAVKLAEQQMKYQRLKKAHEEAAQEYSTKLSSAIELQKSLDFKTIKKLQNDLDSLNEKLIMASEEVVKQDREKRLLEQQRQEEQQELQTIICEKESIIEAMVEEQKEMEKQFAELGEMLEKQQAKFDTSCYEKWKQEHEVLELQLQDAHSRKQHLEEKADELSSAITDRQDRLDRLNTAVDNFIENIDIKAIELRLGTLLKEKGGEDQGQKEHAMKVLSKIKLYLRDSNTYQAEKNITTRKELLVTLGANLEAVGIRERNSEEMAKLLISCLQLRLAPILCGVDTRKLAAAISTALFAESPYIISLPNGFCETMQLEELIQKSQSNCILIEDAFESMNESALLPLLRAYRNGEWSSRILLLSCESLRQLKYVKEYFYRYACLIKGPETRIIHEVELIKAQCPQEFLNQSPAKVLKEIKSYWSILFDGLPVEPAYSFSRIQLLSNGDFLSPDRMLAVLYEHELWFYSMNYGLSDQLEKNMKANDNRTMLTLLKEREKYVGTIN